MSDVETLKATIDDIKATYLDLDFEGEQPQVMVTIQTMVYLEPLGFPADTADVFLDADGSYQIYVASHPVEKVEHLFDIKVTENGEGGSLTPAQFAQVTGRFTTVVDQAIAALREQNIALDLTGLDADSALVAETGIAIERNARQLLAAANAGGRS